jgi:glycine oxidase
VAKRIAIVGDGIIGLSLAYRLANSPARPQIVVFGPEDIAEHYAGSWAAPAMVNVFGEVTTKHESSWAARHMLDIGIKAMQMWPEFLDRLNRELTGLGEVPLDLHRGTYLVARPGRAKEKANLGAVRKALNKHGYPFENLKLDGRPEGPIIRPERFEDGIFVPDEMFVDARRVWAGLRTCLAAKPNVQFRAAQIEGIEPGALTLRDESGGTTEADAVVLANSFGFNRIADGLGLTGAVPYLVRVFGVGLRTAGNARGAGGAAVVRTPVYGASCGDYAVHFPDFTYVGASALTNTDRVEMTTQVQRSLDFYDPHTNLNGLTLTGGVRAMAQDTYPLIGKLQDGIWAAAGFFKSGVTLAPYVAELLARELVGEPQPHTNLFSPYRRVDEALPSNSELTETIWDEIESSASSSGARAQLQRYGWLVEPVVRWRVAWIARRFRKGIYYNSDLVQLCAYDRSMIDRLNVYNPPEELPAEAAAVEPPPADIPRRKAA